MAVSGFLDERRLIHGPWQAFERDVARLLIANGFDDVRIVGGTGDHGADILGVLDNQLWILQCKHTTTCSPPKDAISEIVEAARFYQAHRLMVATSRTPGAAFISEKEKYERMGLHIPVADPTMLLTMMDRTPTYSKNRRVLRNYQEDTANKFRRALTDTGRGQIVFATGLGKTIVMADVVADLLEDQLVPHGRVLVLAHTRDLVDQLHESFWFQLPKSVPTHQLTEAEFPTFWDGITFATIQSVRSHREQLPEFGLVLVDEAHHIGAEMFRTAISSLRPKMLGGVTATPWRGDGYDIDQILGPALVRIGIAEGLQREFLSEVDYRLLGDNIDWELVQKASERNYSLNQLNKRLIIPTRDEQAARIVRDVYDVEKRQRGVVFSPTIVHAQHFAAMLRKYSLKAEAISSDNTARERDRLMSRFRAGQLQFLTTVDLFNEGVDVPDVDTIVFMRVTHSRRIFVQQLGRGLRVTPTKRKVVVLDFVTDLRRVAEVLELDAAIRSDDVERLGLGPRIVEFTDRSAGTFLREWLLDQASLFEREDDPKIELPQFDYPLPPPPGGVQ